MLKLDILNFCTYWWVTSMMNIQLHILAIKVLFSNLGNSFCKPKPWVVIIVSVVFMVLTPAIVNHKLAWYVLYSCVPKTSDISKELLSDVHQRVSPTCLDRYWYYDRYWSCANTLSGPHPLNFCDDFPWTKSLFFHKTISPSFFFNFINKPSNIFISYSFFPSGYQLTLASLQKVGDGSN